MRNPPLEQRKTELIVRSSPDFFPALAHAEFDEVWAWAEDAVLAKGGSQLADGPRPAILDRLERRGFSAARVFAAVVWLKSALAAKRAESAVSP
ncbi:MAG TPA: hypothetical protein VGY55_25465 [Pirellulales bacterium]|jgi:hypothetical protein|nr:hypothetical protein [Pirellulales bacterium]